MFVLLLAGGLVAFVLHLKHNGEDFDPLVVILAVDIVPLGTRPGIIVLAELGLREHAHAIAVEFVLAVLLQALTNHLGGLLSLEVLVKLNGFVLLAQLQFVLLLISLARQLGFLLL